MHTSRRRIPAIVFSKQAHGGKRLAKRIGAPDAALVQHRLLTRTLRHLGHGGLGVVVAVSADAPEFAALAHREGAHTILQPRGSTGQRIAEVLRHAPRGALVVESDAPGLDGVLVSHARDALGLFDLVLGPTWSGGTYLIGLRSPAHTFRLFRGVRWGTHHTLEDVLARVPRHWIVGLLPILSDANDTAVLREAAFDYGPPRRRSSSLGVISVSTKR